MPSKDASPLFDTKALKERLNRLGPDNPLPFACALGKSADEHLFVLHKTLDGKKLVAEIKSSKAGAKLQKHAWGKATLKGKPEGFAKPTLVLDCEKNPFPNLERQLKALFKVRKLPALEVSLGGGVKEAPQAPAKQEHQAAPAEKPAAKADPTPVPIANAPDGKQEKKAEDKTPQQDEQKPQGKDLTSRKKAVQSKLQALKQPLATLAKQGDLDGEIVKPLLVQLQKFLKTSDPQESEVEAAEELIAELAEHIDESSNPQKLFEPERLRKYIKRLNPKKAYHFAFAAGKSPTDHKFVLHKTRGGKKLFRLMKRVFETDADLDTKKPMYGRATVEDKAEGYDQPTLVLRCEKQMIPSPRRKLKLWVRANRKIVKLKRVVIFDEDGRKLPAEPDEPVLDEGAVPTKEGAGADPHDAQRQAAVQQEYGLKDEQTRRLEDWIAKNYMAESFFDELGGERLAAALKGNDETLGKLSENEASYLLERTLRKWIFAPYSGERGAEENVEDLTNQFKDADPATKLQLGLTYLKVYDEVGADQNHEFTHWEPRNTSMGLLRHSLDLAPNSFVQQYGVVLGGQGLAQYLNGQKRKNIGPKTSYYDVQNPYYKPASKGQKLAALGSVGDGWLDEKGTNGFVSYMQGMTAEEDIEDAKSQGVWAKAFARVLKNKNKLDDVLALKARKNIQEVLGGEGGRQLLFGEQIPPPMREWALQYLSPDPNDPKRQTWTKGQLAKGWESDVVGLAFNEKALEEARRQFPGPITLDAKGETGVTSNALGQMLGIPPNNLPGKNETKKTRDARLEAGFGHSYYKSDESPMKKILGHVAASGGENPRVTSIPITWTSNDKGAAVFKLLRIETNPEGTAPIFVDHRGNRYDNAKHWIEDNEMPPGRLTYPAELDIKNGPVHSDSPANDDWVWTAIDVAAMVAGTIAGVVILVGSGGTAAPIVAGMAAVYSGARAGEKLHDKAEKGHDIADLGDPEIRGLMIELVSSTLSVGAIGGGLRATQLLKTGSKMSRLGANMVATMTVAGSTIDCVAMGDAMIQLSKNWDKMTPEQKSMALLQLSFQFGMQAASAKAGGGRFRDQFDFKRTRNQLENGTPYDIEPAPKELNLAPGQVAVHYTTENGYPSKFRIVYEGDSPPSREMIDLHSQAAASMEASVSLEKRFLKLLGDREGPPPGSRAWEALEELKKIRAESKLVMDRLKNPDISPEEAARLKSRMDDLNGALIEERSKLDLCEEKGRGFVAAPGDAVEARKAHGLADVDAPPEYHWRANGRDKDGNWNEPLLYGPRDSKSLKYDKQSGKFVTDVKRSASLLEGAPADLKSVRRVLDVSGEGLGETQFVTSATKLLKDVQGAIDRRVKRIGHSIGKEFVAKPPPPDTNTQRNQWKARWDGEFKTQRQMQGPLLALREKLGKAIADPNTPAEHKGGLQSLKQELDVAFAKSVDIPDDHGPGKHLFATNEDQANRSLFGVNPITGGVSNGASASGKFRNPSDFADAASTGKHIADSGFQNLPPGATVQGDPLTDDYIKVVVPIKEVFADPNATFYGVNITNPNLNPSKNITYNFNENSGTLVPASTGGSSPRNTIKKILKSNISKTLKDKHIKDILTNTEIGLSLVNYEGGTIRMNYIKRDGEWQLNTMFPEPTAANGGMVERATIRPDVNSGYPPKKWQLVDSTGKVLEPDYDINK